MLAKHPDYRIICLDKLTYAGNLSTLVPIMDVPNFRFLQADICDREAVDKLFEEEHPDILVNFAAESHVDRSIENPGVFLQTNIMGAATLMDACCKYGIRRYHQISTDEVYGDLTFADDAKPFSESALIRPSSPYSSSKASADLLVMAYHRTYGLPVSISRCSNNYGPYQFPEKLIPLMLANALADKPLPVYGEGLNVRDWLYVEDHCKAIDLIIHNGRVGEVYNIGGHNEMRNIDIVKLICKELGKSEDLITYVGCDVEIVYIRRTCPSLGDKCIIGIGRRSHFYHIAKQLGFLHRLLCPYASIEVCSLVDKEVVRYHTEFKRGTTTKENHGIAFRHLKELLYKSYSFVNYRLEILCTVAYLHQGKTRTLKV